MVYKSRQDMMPDYITALLTEYKPPRSLRSSEDKQLVIIKTHLHYGDISFQVATHVSCGMRHIFHSKLFLNLTVSRVN